MKRALRTVLACIMLALCVTAAASATTPTFKLLTRPADHQFLLTPADSINGYGYENMLGGVRSITTGDYDQDGDEDVIVTRFADDIGQFKSPQFVLYENLFYDTVGGNASGELTGNRLRFRIHANILGTLTKSMFSHFPADWPEAISNSEFDSITTADFNDDGWPDIIAGGVYSEKEGFRDIDSLAIVDRSLLFINCRDGFHFKEVGVAAGINDNTVTSTGASVADYNNDGRLDIFMANTDRGQCEHGNGANNALYLADTSAHDNHFDYTKGGTTYTIYYPTFVNGTSAFHVVPAGSSTVHHYDPTAADVDRDGWIDMYVGLRAPCDMQRECTITRNEFLHNLGGTPQAPNGFENRAAASSVDDSGNAYGAAWGDWDNDGNLDLLLSNNIMGENQECPADKEIHSKLYRHVVGAGNTHTFAATTVSAFRTPVGTQTNNGCFFFDFDLDGLQDFFMAVEANGDSLDPVGSTLYRQSSPGVFDEVTFQEGATIPLSKPPLNYLYECGGSMFLSRVINGANSTYADFDLDGDLDLFATSNLQNPDVPCKGTAGEWTYVFRNETRNEQAGGGNHYISVRLQGTPPVGGGFGADRNALGSVARVYAGGKMYSQQVCAGGQDGSSWPFELTFGLGATTTVDSIVVDWHHSQSAGSSDAPYHQRIDGPSAADQRYPVIGMPTVIRVPNDQLVLQTAITNAAVGSVILVALFPAVSGALTLKPGVRLEAVGPQTIDAAGGTFGVAVSAANNGAGTAIVGFTIKNFNGSAVNIYGGGSQPVTVENCTIEGSAYATRNGVVSSGTAVRVVNCAFVGPSAKGVQLGVDFSDNGTKSLVVSGCRFANVDQTGVSRAIRVSAGSGPVTVVSNSAWNYEYGVEVVAGTTGSVFRKNLFAIGATAGVGIFGNPPSTNNVVENNDCYGFLYNYDVNGYHGTVPPGNVSSAPDFASTSDLTLNINSPCARQGNAAHVWIGARPYVSTMYGVLANPMDLPLTDLLKGTIGLPKDLKVPAGKSLILGGGMKVNATGPTTGANYGADSTRSEIVAEGGRIEARYDVALGQGVSFASSLNPQSVNAWGGLVAKNGGKVILNHAAISNCTQGVYGADLADSIRVEDCTISKTEGSCISVQNTTAASMLYVKGGTFDLSAPSTAWAGLYGVGCKSIFIDGTTVTGRGVGGGVPGATYGLKVGAPSSGGSQPEIWEAQVSGFTAGSGLFVESGSASLRGCQVGGCKWGAQLLGSGSPGITGLSAPGRSAATALTNCTTGAYINSTGSPNITGGTISAGTSSGIVGLSTAGSASGNYSGLTISGTSTAIIANSTGPDHLFNSSVTGFSYVGIQASVSGQIVLGGSSELGNNIHSGLPGVIRYVGTKPPRTIGIPDIDAQYNWWGEYPAPTAKFGSWVDYSNELTEPLSNAGRRVVDLSADVPLKRLFAVHPNPSTNQVVMSFTVPVGLRTPVDLRVFDISGRLVRTLLSETLDPGDRDAVWDGRNASGVQAPAGLYFARLRLGLEINTRKMLRLPR